MATTAPPQPGITQRSAVVLASAIRSGEVGARDLEVLERAQPRINAIAAARYEEARHEADAVDVAVAAGGGGELPPLAGVPCTIKESIAVRGMPNCAGVVARREFRSTQTAPASQRLLDAGAILLGVTNTAEFCAWLESENRVYGRTSNAYDRRRIAGGSSGGEGAAVGCGGSPIGLGADRILFLTDVPGLLLEDAVVAAIDSTEAEGLLDAGELEGGIVPKLRAAVTAARVGVRAEIGETAVLA